MLRVSDEQLEATRARYEAALATTKGFRDQMLAMVSVMTKICGLLKTQKDISTWKLTKTNSTTILNLHVGKPKAPGLPGFQMIHFDHLQTVLNTLSDDFTLFQSYLHRHLLVDVNALITETNDMIKKLNTRIEKHIEARKKAVNNVVSAIKSYELGYNKVYAAFTSNKCKSKKELEQFYEKIAELSTICNQTVAIFNYCHKRAMDSMICAVIEFKEFEKMRLERICRSIQRFASEYDSLIKIYAKCYQNITSVSIDWTTEFRRFIEEHCVYRTALPHIKFEAYKFHFKDHPIALWSVPANPYETEPPMFFSTVSVSFNGNNKNELSVKQGEKVFILEPPISEWILVRSEKGIGFVPLCALKFEYSKVAICHNATLTRSLGGLNCRPFDIVKIVTKHSKYYDIEDSEGYRGRIMKDECTFE